ncbi:MAG: FTR1 family protein [Candidatus Bathyarchaeia archaeon]
MAGEAAGFLITFRESLEATLIVAIIVAYLSKIGRNDLKRYAWLGTAAAIAVSISIGGAILLFYGGLTGVGAKLFEGAAAVTATGVLTFMIIWMARNAHRIKGSLQHKIDTAILAGSTAGVAALAFIAVVREGIETVLFMSALITIDPMGTATGGVLGVSAVALLAIGIIRGSYRLDLRKFFTITSIALVVFAAGLLGYGVHEFIEAFEKMGISLGVLGQTAYNINPADASDIFHEKGAVGSMLKALLGYDGNPEILRVVAYSVYWAIAGFYLTRVYIPLYMPTLRRANGISVAQPPHR